MLHIILLILKWIGILLASLLALILLIVLIILFVPVRYKVSGVISKDMEETDIQGKMTFLFSLIKCSGSYKENQFNGFIRILFKKFPSQEEKETTVHKKKKPWLPSKKKKQNESRVVKSEEIADHGARPKEDSEQEHPTTKVEVQQIESKAEVQIAKGYIASPDSYKNGTEKEKEKEKKKAGFFKRISDKIKDFLAKVKAIKSKISYTFHKICDNITVLSGKKDIVMDFIHSDIHRKAIKIVKDELQKFFRRNRPKRFRVDARVGFEDPCTTGNILAIAAVVYPLLGGSVCLTPDFETEILKGTVLLKGKIRLIHVLVAVWNVFWSKHVRRTYKDFMIEKEKLA